MESSIKQKEKRKRTSVKAPEHVRASKSAMSVALKSDWFFTKALEREQTSRRDVRGALLLRGCDTVRAWGVVVAAAEAAKARAEKAVASLTKELDLGKPSEVVDAASVSV
jgi:hypothetical protein